MLIFFLGVELTIAINYLKIKEAIRKDGVWVLIIINTALNIVSIVSTLDEAEKIDKEKKRLTTVRKRVKMKKCKNFNEKILNYLLNNKKI